MRKDHCTHLKLKCILLVMSISLQVYICVCAAICYELPTVLVRLCLRHWSDRRDSAELLGAGRGLQVVSLSAYLLRASVQPCGLGQPLASCPSHSEPSMWTFQWGNQTIKSACCILTAYGALHHQHALIWNFMLYSLCWGVCFNT